MRTHAQTFASPAPPQVVGAGQVPQLSIFPQPSAIMPQLAPRAAHVVGLHPHLPDVPPPPQVAGATHGLPQSSALPHPSEACPHSTPTSEHFFGTQGARPHWFTPPPPHTRGAAQLLQSSVPPQSSGTVPQAACFDAHVAGTHPHRLGATAPHCFPSEHVPQSIVWPQPS